MIITTILMIFRILVFENKTLTFEYIGIFKIMFEYIINLEKLNTIINS